MKPRVQPVDGSEIVRLAIAWRRAWFAVRAARWNGIESDPDAFVARDDALAALLAALDTRPEVHL